LGMKQTAVALATALMCVAQAQAATTTRDIQVMARAVGFVTGLPRGAIDVAIVDGPGTDAVLAQMAEGVSASGITLRARRVSLAQLAGSGVRVVIVPEGQGASHAAIAQAAQRLGAVTISTDMSCVRAGRCVVGVAAQPRVEIVVSRTAASAANISFGQAFRVMIREI
jgi:hypothetical protein